MEPVNVSLFGKRVFFTYDHVKDLKMRSAWIIHVGPECHHKCPYETGIGRSDTCREGNVITETEIGVMRPQANECQQPTEARKRQGDDSPLEPPEGVWP